MVVAPWQDAAMVAPFASHSTYLLVDSRRDSLSYFARGHGHGL